MQRKFVGILLLGFLVLLALPAQAATNTRIYLTPSSGRLNLGNEFEIEVLADTQGSSVNTAEANLTFSSNTLELLSVTQGSTFVLPTPDSKLVEGNTIYIGGGLPTPGYNGKSGVIGVLKFRAKAIGRATVNLTRGRMLLNDGNGSSANVSTSGASFDITPAAVGSVEVYSPTHSNQQAWSNHNDVELAWILPAGAKEVSYIWDQSPDTIPDDIIDPSTTNSISFPKTADGTWYFHIKARGSAPNYPFGQTVNYKVSIDTVAPTSINLKLLHEKDDAHVSTTPSIAFSAIDATSGVWRYDVYMDNKFVKELADEPFLYDGQELGDHVIKVIGYDRAGNSIESKLPITITPTTAFPASRPVSWPVIIVTLNALLLLAVGVVIYRQNKQLNVSHNSVDRIISIENRMPQVAGEISSLRQIMDVRFREVNQKIETEIRRSVAEIKSEIDVRISRLNDPVKVAKARQQVSMNLASEIRSTHNSTELEVLQRLYNEFVYNKT